MPGIMPRIQKWTISDSYLQGTIIGLWEQREHILENKFNEQQQQKSALGDFPNGVRNSEFTKELCSTSSF